LFYTVIKISKPLNIKKAVKYDPHLVKYDGQNNAKFNAMKLDPVSLKLFIRTIEEGTISRTAKKEHIAAAAISKRISDLENELNTALIIRTHRGVEPTCAGKALIGMARKILHDLDEISLQLTDYSNGLRGLIRVGANISAITQFLPDDIKSFCKTYPEVQIHLKEQISPTILKSVEDNSVDLGIFSSTYAKNNIQTLSYKTDRLCLIVPALHPLAKNTHITLEEILEFDIVGLHRGSNINYILEHAASRIRKTPNTKVHVTGFDTLCLMVESGLGVGILPEQIGHRYSKLFSITPIKIMDEWAERQIDICVRSYDSLSKAAQLFIDHLRKNKAVS